MSDVRYLTVTETRTYTVRLTNPDIIERYGDDDGYDSMDLYEDMERWRNAMGGGNHMVEGGVWAELHDDPPPNLWGESRSIDDDAPSKRLWLARHHINKAVDVLGRSRYVEGHCPTLDNIRGVLNRLSDLMIPMAREVEADRDGGGFGTWADPRDCDVRFELAAAPRVPQHG